ncbi:MAG: amidohydrolase family protein, partial [Acidimicrobiia bacterium]
PGTTATAQEVYAIAEVLRERGLFQAVLNTGDLDPDMELLTTVGIITGGRVIVASAAVDGARPGAPVTSRFKQPTPDMLERAAARGADITATLMPREGGAICGLYGKLPWRTDAWRQLAGLPHEQRLDAIRQPKLRRALVDEALDAPSITAPNQIFAMWTDSTSEPARYMAGPDATLAALSLAAGESPAETFLRCCDLSDGRAMFSAVLFNRDSAVLASMLDSPRFLPGLGDAGAHLADIVDASYTTFFLAHWVRDTGRVGLGEAIRRLTSAPAALLGVADRGRLEVGCVADINVIDLDALAAMQCEPVYDAPLGAPRLVQRARGYRATFVNGQAIVRNDEHTGVHAGRVLRSFG